MSHELFVIERKEALDDQEKRRADYLRDKLQTVEGLGLEVQAVTIRADLATIERGRLITTAPMTPAELTIWRAWLPTVYNDLGIDRTQQLANYNFDRIPQPVLKIWEKHKLSGAFERFEIWTPEVVQPDPILVGVNGRMRHLLARWGESDANLVSFDDIKKELVRRWHANETIGNEPIEQRRARQDRDHMATVHGYGYASAIGAPLAVGVSLAGVPLLLGFLIGGAVGSAFGYVIFRRRQKSDHAKLALSSDLMKAIAKDEAVPRELLPAA